MKLDHVTHRFEKRRRAAHTGDDQLVSRTSESGIHHRCLTPVFFNGCAWPRKGFLGQTAHDHGIKLQPFQGLQSGQHESGLQASPYLPPPQVQVCDVVQLVATDA